MNQCFKMGRNAYNRLIAKWTFEIKDIRRHTYARIVLQCNSDRFMQIPSGFGLFPSIDCRTHHPQHVATALRLSTK